MAILFNRSKELEGEISNFLSIIQESGLIFKETINDYLNGYMEQFEERIIKVNINEEKADESRRKIKFSLYTHMLIPEARGDVLV